MYLCEVPNILHTTTGYKPGRHIWLPNHAYLRPGKQPRSWWFFLHNVLAN